jgi:hypothetical protein
MIWLGRISDSVEIIEVDSVPLQLDDIRVHVYVVEIL